MKSILVAPSICMMAGVLLGTWWPEDSSHADASRLGPIAPASRGPACQAAEAPVTVEAVPDRSVQMPGGSRALSYRVNVRSSIEGNALVSLATQILNPSYQVVSPLRTEVTGERLMGGLLTRQVSVGSELSDGYYVVRVAASVSNGEVLDTVAADSFIAVRGGDPEPISGEQFMAEASPNGSVSGFGWDERAVVNGGTP